MILSTTFSTAYAEKGSKDSPNGKLTAETFMVCSDKSEGNACSFNTPDNNFMEVTCIEPRKTNASLVCKPNCGKYKGNSYSKRD